MKIIKKYLLLFCLISLHAFQYISANISTHTFASHEELLEMRSVNQKKPITLIIFAAADNDLHPFIWKNLKQMEAIGSNENINIIVQLNTPGYFNPTKRYIIKQGRRLLVPAEGIAPTQKLNSGSPYTLIECASWAMKHYPADKLIINLWNHGAGVYDPGVGRIVNASELFQLDPESHMLELDRSIGYIDLMNQESSNEPVVRGICFDETFKSYMTNQDLKFALSEIQHNVLGGNKIGAIWFDACLMAMLEIANICKDHVEYMIASEEVELASGSNYEMVLKPFLDRPLSISDFACHVVNSYEKAYINITRDFTQSAMDLSKITDLETNVNLVAGQLLIALSEQRNNTVITALKQSKSRPACACFEEPSYIDLGNFYTNLQSNLSNISMTNLSHEALVKSQLNDLINQGLQIINTTVIANKTGSNLQKALGISIYFPERGIFNSYPKCNFAQTNNWSKMLVQYILCKK